MKGPSILFQHVCQRVTAGFDFYAVADRGVGSPSFLNFINGNEESRALQVPSTSVTTSLSQSLREMCLESPYSPEVMSVNTSPARVVPATRPNNAILVNILGQFTTLMRTQRISWLNRAPHAWDRVLVPILPDAIHVMPSFLR